MKDKLSASEALFGFASWLTCRQEVVTLSAAHDAAPIAELVKVFCERNILTAPREGWDKCLVPPKWTNKRIPYDNTDPTHEGSV